MSTVIVIFGATGDLTARKLIPGLYNNFRKKRLPDQVHVIGYGRKPFSTESYRDKIQEAVRTFAAE
jgi:glucose-6-phosphate 1-dehydrogenase